MYILLVDDDKDVIKPITQILQDFGHQTICASDGASAIHSLMTQDHIDLVISDIRMPKMDGIELLRQIQMRAPGLPVLLMTGYGDESIAIRAFKEGAFDYIKKPVSLRTLLNVIQRLEHRRKLEARFLAPDQHANPYAS